MHNIYSSSFYIHPKANAYELHIQFFDGKNNPVSKKILEFKQVFKGEGTLFDVFTKNGNCKSSLEEHLFEKRDEKEAKSALALLKAEEISGPHVLVLDLQDPHTHYESADTIEKCEQAVCTFFQAKQSEITGSKTTKRMHAFFHSNLPVDFIICEGSLKVDLLKYGGFSQQQKEYFQKTEAGKLSFCQCAEFFMNAFKFGQVATMTTFTFTAEKYIRPIAHPTKAFTPCQFSTTLYPPQYKEMYSATSEFATLLRKVFSVTGNCDTRTGITTLKVARPL